MSDLKRLPDIQARFDAWAIWLHSVNSGGGSQHPLARLMDWASGKRVSASGDGGYRSVVPVDDLECSSTDRAIRALPKELRQAVSVWHGGHGTREQVAAQLGIQRRTLQRRLAQADHRVAEWFEQQRMQRHLDGPPPRP